jgi:ABC-type sugar transport system substrate-binding protein
LSEFVVHVPDADALERVLARLAEAGVPVAPDNLVRDPSGNGVRLATRETSG